MSVQNLELYKKESIILKLSWPVAFDPLEQQTKNQLDSHL